MVFNDVSRELFLFFRIIRIYSVPPFNRVLLFTVLHIRRFSFGQVRPPGHRKSSDNSRNLYVTLASQEGAARIFEEGSGDEEHAAPLDFLAGC